jgi:hypothetical protein
MTTRGISTDELVRRIRTRPDEIVLFLESPESAPLWPAIDPECWPTWLRRKIDCSRMIVRHSHSCAEQGGVYLARNSQNLAAAHGLSHDGGLRPSPRERRRTVIDRKRARRRSSVIRCNRRSGRLAWSAVVRAVGVEPTRAVKPCGFSYHFGFRRRHLAFVVWTIPSPLRR